MHSHHHPRLASWVVRIALLATLGLVATEFVAGVLAHSLALVSDGWHNLTDVPTLVLSWIALYLERRPPDQQRTYGYQRAGVLAAFVNALILVGVALFLCYQGYERILRPVPVASGTMLIVGAVALVVNGGISFALASERSDLNLRAVFIHNLGDALSNLAIIAGAWLIRATGRTIIDPAIAFLISGMILWTAVGIITDSANILLESLPKGMSLEGVATCMLGVAGVKEVHDVHIWSLGSSSHALSCHVHILDMPTSESEQIAHQIREALAREFGIHHTTIQFEHTHPPGEFHIYMPDSAPDR
ncbi:MAG: cation diffusion facilitator family transporter [Acidobacteriia bacterium]|nr:cation diffusion facilitator family transporter [Terriglobia bacterium]